MDDGKMGGYDDGDNYDDHNGQVRGGRLHCSMKQAGALCATLYTRTKPMVSTLC